MSRRRRPIGSPPGRGHDRAAEAREQRAGEQDRGAHAAAAGSPTSSFRVAGAPLTRTSFGPSTRPPRRCRRGAHHRLDVADARDVLEPHLLLRRGRRRRAAAAPRSCFRPPARGPRGASALDDECFGKRVRDGAFGHRCTLARPVEITRETAWDTLTRHTQERGAAPPRARRRGLGPRLRPPLRRGRGLLGHRRLAARFRLGDPSDARPASAGRCADPARRGLSGGRDRGDPLARRAPLHAAGHPAEEDALRLRRDVGIRPRVRARPAGRHRLAHAEVGEEEAEAAVVRRRRPPRRGIQGSRGSRRGAGRAHRLRDRRMRPIAPELGLRTSADVAAAS